MFISMWRQCNIIQTRSGDLLRNDWGRATWIDQHCRDWLEQSFCPRVLSLPSCTETHWEILGQICFPVPIARIQPKRQVSSSPHDQIVDTCSDPERFSRPYPQQLVQRVWKSRPICKSNCFEVTTLKTILPFFANSNGSRHSDRRDQWTTITKFVTLSFTRFIDLAFHTYVLWQILVCPPIRASDAEETSCVVDLQSEMWLGFTEVRTFHHRTTNLFKNSRACRKNSANDNKRNWDVRIDKKILQLRDKIRANEMLTQTWIKKKNTKLFNPLQPSWGFCCLHDMGTVDRLAKLWNLCPAFKSIGNHQPNDHVVHIRDTLTWTFSQLTCLANVWLSWVFARLSFALSREWWNCKLVPAFTLILSLAAQTREQCSRESWQFHRRSLQFWGLFVSEKTLDRSLENRQLQLTAPPVHFAQNPGGPQNSHQLSSSTLSVSAHSWQSREHCGIDVGTMCLLVSDTLDEDPARSFLSRRELSIRFTVLVDVHFRKDLTKTFHVIDSEVFVWATQQSTVLAALVSSLLFSSASSLAHRRLSAHVSHCPRVLMPSSNLRDVVSDTLAPLPLNLVRGKEHAVVVAVQAQFQAWPSRLRYLDGFCLLFVLRCQGCLLLWETAPGQSSPDQLVVLLSSHQPVALQLTSWLQDSRLILERRTSCWQSRQSLGSPSHCCERGVVDQRVRLLIRGSAQGEFSPNRPIQKVKMKIRRIK